MAAIVAHQSRAAPLDQEDIYDKSLRNMKVIMSTTSARACRANCIDQDQYFCANEDFSEGVCCDSQDESCRQSGGICSFDLPDEGYVQGHYFVCPFDKKICGEDRKVEISDDISEKVEITNLSHEETDDFIFGQLCSYELLWPESVVNENTMILKAV